jgi:drug/metabolite transporter (DMT)-like permease
MIQGISIAVLAATIYGFLGLAFEVAAKRGYPNWDFILYKQCFGTLLGLVVTLALRSPLFEPHVMILAFVGAVFYVFTCFAYLTASREREIAANWTILNLSVIVPVLLSVILFHDKFSYSKMLGFAFTLAAIILIGGLGSGKMTFSRQWVLWIALAFLLNGWFVILLRFVPGKLSSLFTLYFYGFSAILALVYKMVLRQGFSRAAGIYQVAAYGAAAHWSGIMLTMIALYYVGRANGHAGLVVYPITNGLTIVMGVAIGSLFLHQAIATREKWGMACGIVAMIFLSFA